MRKIRLVSPARTLLLTLVVFGLGLSRSFAADPVSPAAEKIEAREKYLLLDSRLIARSENAKLQKGEVVKYSGNPLFKEEYEWEPRFDNLYPNVIWDEEDQLYKCWYSPFIISNVDLETSTPSKVVWKNREMAVCYATSKDGYHWVKPMLDIVLWNSKPSNILYRDAHGAGVIKDLHETDPARRYKMFFRHDTKAGNIVSVAFSADGLHWSAPQAANVNGLKADTHNNAFWAPTLGKYVAYTRDWSEPTREGTLPPGSVGGGRVRVVSRSESTDFISWSAPTTVLRGDDDRLQTYSMPVFFYQGVYLGFPVLFNTVADRAHTELAWSPDTTQWNRISGGQALVPTSPRLGDFDWGCVYSSQPVIRSDEIRIYYGGSDGFHFGVRKGFFALATLRPDHFAGLTPATAGQAATIETVPLSAPAQGRIGITADIEQGGALEISWDAPTGGGAPLPTKTLTLKGPQSLNNQLVAGGEFRAEGNERLQLRFKLKRGTLYAFSLKAGQ